ncbi:DNA polymerase ligase N-terminal domain-containing protein [Streptomyces sp. NRRL F-5727]|uniref:DNA polymerase ligase N-terminal domain-containing protein n=1 Tax=Streptomyces sp. NRRL F-5727 TaxID=1463871 RepID=UPI0004CA214A|nr:DNA polymerase ligase N-terminal domain-containing protein [Streptomyces sp. NRRL F-5727]
MAASDGTLTEYRRKRDFRRTREPEGKSGGGDGREPVFVVQIHDATSMHFDFRLEVDGVLKSWSVPKGPSGDPHDKRLAMPTEDHPLEYRDFEGTIAPGEYGAGTVIIWDEGRYENRSTDQRGHEVPFAEALDAGHASFRLAGRKLHGDWALTRFRKGADGEREAWLLVRHGRTAHGTTPDPRRARSARSGRTLKKVAEEAESGKEAEPGREEETEGG